ncbi:MAG: zinc ribbon domain-containing protein [Janthinobacterium lividum]
MMLDPIFCVSCKKAVDPSWTNCPHCGSLQKLLAMSPLSMPQPVYIVQQVVNPQIVIDECTKQYQNLNWLAFAGIFFVGAYFLGLGLIIFAVVQKPNLRRKVAELGVSPDAWEKPLRAQFVRLMVIGFATLVVISVGTILFLFKFNQN